MSESIENIQDLEEPVSPDALSDALHKATFLRIKALGRRSRAIGLRLRVGDIVVAVNGEPFHGSPADLADRLTISDVEPEPSEDDEFMEAPSPVQQESQCLLTICRGGIFFEVFAYGPLGCDLDYLLPEEAEGVALGLSQHKIYPMDKYIGYEVFRDITRRCVLIDQTPSMIPAVMPLAWLIQNRMIEPILAVVSVYALTLGINPIVFAITYILTAVYFHRGQLVFQRSYAMFNQRHMWIYVVATNPRDAQIICRRLDPKADFAFSLIPPPRPERKTAQA